MEALATVLILMLATLGPVALVLWTRTVWAHLQEDAAWDANQAYDLRVHAENVTRLVTR